MKRAIRSLSLAVLVAAAGFACAQQIYEPTQSIQAQGISVQGWGSGSIAETDEIALEGPNSIRVSSRNFFQGGQIQFSNPIDLNPIVADKYNLIKFSLNVPTAATGGSSGAVGGPGGFGGAAGVGGAPGSGSNAGITNPGSEGQSQASAANQYKPLSKIRLVFTTTDGKHGEAYLDITTAVKNESGWFTVGLPLQAIRGLENTNRQLASVSLSGDSISTFYVGQIEVVKDSTPVYGEPAFRELNLAFGDEVTFSATGYGGITPVRFLWDFDSSDGIQIDAEGPVVNRRFRREGTFTVTLTVIDSYGLKEPYSTTITVTVNP